MERIVFVATAITAPYVIKKVKAFRKAGYDTILYAYNRGKSFERAGNEELGEVVDLGYLESGGGYVGKLYKHIGTLKRIYKENESSDCLYILFSFDLALINWLFFKKDYVYHISDLTYAKMKLKGVVNIFRKIDRQLIRKSLLTIVTSRGFQNFIFPDGKCADKIIEIPNLLQEDNPYERKEPQFVKSIENLSIGFVGLNRYKSPLNIAKVVGKYFPNMIFHFYGNGFDSVMSEIDKMCAEYPNIKSHGRFNSTVELQKIYDSIDLLICCYDIENTNVKIAEPNKLYEAIYFNKPIVVSTGTYLATRVKTLGVGYDIDASDEHSIRCFFDKLTLEELNTKINTMHSIPAEDLIDKGELVVNSIINRDNNARY